MTSTIDPKARVWTITLGKDGKLVAELDPKRLERLKQLKQLKQAA